MKKEELLQLISEQFKLVRTESNHHQDEMATILGLSKKTLIQIEKGRQTATWIQAVSLCALFQESNILQNAIGGNPIEIIQTIAQHHYQSPKPKTLGGKVWWINQKTESGFILQQNLVTKHYRILDEKDRRWFSSLDEKYILDEFERITGDIR